MSETSPTPWRLNGRIIVAGDPSDEINVAEMCGSMSNPDIAADGALIVQAVNCHAEMVEALQDLIRVMPIDMDPLQKQALRKAEAALTRATQSAAEL